MGDQLIDWEGDLDDVVIAVRTAGFEVEEFVAYEIGCDVGMTAMARR